MANYDESATVTRGWCQYLQQFLEGIEVNNRGKSGASSKSFYKEAAYWTSVKKADGARRLCAHPVCPQ